MFNKNFKLIATAMGLVAVLVMGLAMPGATQPQPPSPWTPPFRPIIKGGLDPLLGGLTASEGDILDVDNVVFVSHQRLTIAFLPLHPSSRSVQLLQEWLKEKNQLISPITLGALYIENDLPDFIGFQGLSTGLYWLKITPDLKLIAIDSMGEEIHIGFVRVQPVGNPIWKVVGAIIVFCSVADFKVSVTVGSVSVEVGC